jgi:hypothetical protein
LYAQSWGWWAGADQFSFAAFQQHHRVDMPALPNAARDRPYLGTIASLFFALRADVTEQVKTQRRSSVRLMKLNWPPTVCDVGPVGLHG